jgi:hypothetical protein
MIQSNVGWFAAVALATAACAVPSVRTAHASRSTDVANAQRRSIDAGQFDASDAAPAALAPLSGKLEMQLTPIVECTYPGEQLYDTMHCDVELPIVIDNGLAKTLSLHQIHATLSSLRSPSGVTTWDFGDTVKIPAGGSYRFDAKWLKDDTYAFTAELTDAQGVAYRADGHTVVRNSRREAAQAACKACDGTWGPMGLGGHIGCDCKTKDAGKTCYAPSECEGQCIGASPEWMDKTHYREIGKCSPRTSPFGCQSRVEPGIHTGPFHRSTVCVD